MGGGDLARHFSTPTLVARRANERLKIPNYAASTSHVELRSVASRRERYNDEFEYAEIRKQLIVNDAP